MTENLHNDISPQFVYVLQSEWPKFKDPYFRSALFYLLNHYSFNGTVSYGEFNTDNYSPLSGRSLINFFENHDVDKLNIKYYNNENWEDALKFVEPNEILFLPVGKFSLSPLNNNTFGGHEQYNINNRKVKQLIENYNKKFIMVYKAHPNIFNQYRDFNLLMVNKHGVITNEKLLAEDIIVTNLEIE
jgi:site-specific DNA-adenine methylase